MRLAGPAALAAFLSATAAHAECTRIAHAQIFFGEQTTRSDTVAHLNYKIKQWSGGRKVSVRNRAVRCKSFIRLLNEYECHAAATVCR